MNRNRHMQYRRSVYRRRKIRTTIIATVVALLVLFVLFMIIGTALHNKTYKDPYATDEAIDETEDSGESLVSAQTVGAYALPLLEDGSKFADRLAGISPNANAVCVALNSPDGTLLYRSDLASSLSQLSVHPDASSLSNSVTSIDREGFYVSAALYVNSFSMEDALLREVMLSTWGAVACEALQGGAGDVLLIVPDADASHIDRLCALADSIHSTVESSVVGLAVPDTIFEEKNSATLIDKLSEHFNYMALDTSSDNAGGKEDDESYTTEEYIEDRVSGMQLQLMFYKMRVILPRDADSAAQQSFIDTVTKYNITSWQILP